jgi:hypothetical protein
MSLSDVYKRALDTKELAMPKATYERSDVDVFVAGDVIHETEQYWLVPCGHITNVPATAEQVAWMEKETGLKVPEQLSQFLFLSNGAKLFCLYSIGWDGVRLPDPSCMRYPIFSASEIVELNKELWDNFWDALGDDPDFCHTTRLNYIAFCDAHDGNYLAILVEEPYVGQVFFLHHELLFRPFSEREFDREFYPIIAPSFTAWLELLVDTKGWDGFGLRFLSPRF